MNGKRKIFIKKKRRDIPLIPPNDKGSFPDYMRKEIFTQSKNINHLISKYVKAEKINFDFLKIKTEKIKRAYIVGGGADYGCVLAGAYNFEVLVDIPCIPSLLSEFNFSNPILDKSTLVIVVCDDKNNPQCKAALRRIKEASARAIGIFNTDDESSNSISLDFDERGAVSTAGYTMRYVALSLLSLYFGEKNQVVTQLYVKIAVKLLKTLDEKIKHILENEYIIRHFAENLEGKDLLLTGTNVDFASAIYGAYLLSFALGQDVHTVPVGELDFSKNHRENVIGFASNEHFYDVLVKSVKGGIKIIPKNVEDNGVQSICYDDTIPLFNPVLSAVTVQLMAYDIAKQKGKELNKYSK